MNTDYTYALMELKIKAETLESNAPVWQKERNFPQAELCEQTAASCRAAIEKLTHGEGLGIGGGSGD